MNTVKKLPLAMAVVAALCPISVMAQEFTQEQIDAIVAKAVDKALADRQAKIDAAANKKVDVITNPETTAASPDMAPTSRPATRNMSASTAPITAPRRSAVWATKATAANSRSARPSKARRGLSGILT
ncbi:maltoporin [Klebsiella pneumoniae]|nr:maltoporin [Klebsiella pneumoniae]